jgi:acetylornithine deacetylase
MNNLRSLELARSLVEFDSVSSLSNVAISDWVAEFLKTNGFRVERLEYLDENRVPKVSLIAERLPRQPNRKGGIAYLAHTDVVPADDWALDFCGPFHPVLRDDRLFGRGSCDMKGSLACALAAVESLPVENQTAPIYFVATSDEEVGMLGAREVAARSRIFREMVVQQPVAIIGEPTELSVIRAHKGGQTFWITSRGRSAHSSSRDGINANHAFIPILPRLLELQQRTETDPLLQNTDFDPPTLSWNMVLRNEPFATNVTPSTAEVGVFLRCMPNVDHTPLVLEARTLAEQHGLEFRTHSASIPLSVDPQCEAIVGLLELTGQSEAGTVCYATDGCAFGELKQLVVCGPGSIKQAHRNDEWIALEQLVKGTELYRRAFHRWSWLR